MKIFLICSSYILVGTESPNQELAVTVSWTRQGVSCVYLTGISNQQALVNNLSTCVISEGYYKDTDFPACIINHL